MDTARILEYLRSRPGIVGLDGSFGQVAAFVEGVNAAQDGLFLTGFREWLIVRAGVGANLTWRGLVLLLAFPEECEARNSALRSPDKDRQAAATLIGLLFDFLEVRSAPDGFVKIYDSYTKWLRRQEWYSPQNPSYLDREE